LTHVRIWRFYEDQTETTKSQALNLNQYEFQFKASDCFVILVLSRDEVERFSTDIIDQQDCYLLSSGSNFLMYVANGRRSPPIVRA
jgi:hypothetical protein